MKRITQIFNLLLILAAVYFSVNVFYKFVEGRLVHSELILPPYQSPAPVKPEQKSRPSDYQAIVERDLFHTKNKSAEKKPVPVDIESLKQTNLKLKLWGTVSTDEAVSDTARAVIEDTRSKEQSLYKVGDIVQDAEIIEILRNSVVLDVNGSKEKLSVTEETIAVQAPPMSSEREKPVALSRAQIDDALKNVNELMTQAKVKPLFKDGKPDGLIVSTIEPASIFSKMGFRSGDIITSINGQKIESVEDAMAFYKSLTAGNRLSVQMKRRGRPKVIDFNIE